MGGACLAALPLLLAAALAGCGSSSPTTSQAEARAIATAEREFLAADRRASAAARASCSAKSGQAAVVCFKRAVAALEAKPMARFVASIEALLDEGVGPECRAELEETLSTLSSVPSFPGGTAAVCRSESRG